jgi:hypothetical protein
LHCINAVKKIIRRILEAAVGHIAHIISPVREGEPLPLNLEYSLPESTEKSNIRRFVGFVDCGGGVCILVLPLIVFLLILVDSGLIELAHILGYGIDL